MIQHLQTTTATLTVVDVSKIKAQRDKAYDPAQTMTTFLKDIEKETEKLTRARITTDNNELIALVVWRLMEMGEYTDDIKAWDRLPQAQKTWANCKAHFIAAYHTNKAFQKATAGSQGYVNKITETNLKWENFLDTIATASTAENENINAITANQSNLNAQVQQLIAQQAKILEVLASNKMGTGVTQPKAANQPGATERKRKPLDPTGYCWSCGYKVVQGHNSKTCFKKKEGHQDSATREDIKGGKQYNKFWKPSQDF
jgi:hypothetical protein